MKATGFKGLEVWQMAMEVARIAYLYARTLPANEQYGLASQIRRSATSIPANIAEGYGRQTSGAYAQFLRISKGSLNELETHLILAQNLDMPVAEPGMFSLIAALGTKLSHLISAVQGEVREELAPYGAVKDPLSTEP